MEITPEIVSLGGNFVIFLTLLGVGWHVRSSHKKTDSEVSSLRVLLRQFERQISTLTEMARVETKQGSTSNYDEHFSALAKGLRAHHKETEQNFTQTKHNLSRLEGMLGGIRDYLSEKNRLTERLQAGYDFQIIRNFTRQIIRCIEQIDGSNSEKISPDTQALRVDLIDLLYRNGIESFSPEIGTPFSSLRKIAEVLPQKVATDDSELAGKVAEVITPGYRYTFNNNDHRIIMPAHVKIYGNKG